MNEHTWNRASLRDAVPDTSVTVSWMDTVGRAWELPCHLKNIEGGKSVIWSDTDEAGIDDVNIIDAPSDEDAVLLGFAEDLANLLGTLVGDGETCPECGQEISWGGIQAGAPGVSNYRYGTCGCAAREWKSTEHGVGDWAVSHN